MMVSIVEVVEDASDMKVARLMHSYLKARNEIRQSHITNPYFYFLTFYSLKNTTKLKNVLQLYTLTLDMDEDGNFHLKMKDKRNHAIFIFVDKAYSVVIGKAFSQMKKELKVQEMNY